MVGGDRSSRLINWLTRARPTGVMQPGRDLLIAAWQSSCLGLLGSRGLRFSGLDLIVTGALAGGAVGCRCGFELSDEVAEPMAACWEVVSLAVICSWTTRVSAAAARSEAVRAWSRAAWMLADRPHHQPGRRQAVC